MKRYYQKKKIGEYDKGFEDLFIQQLQKMKQCHPRIRTHRDVLYTETAINDEGKCKWDTTPISRHIPDITDIIYAMGTVIKMKVAIVQNRKQT